MDRSLDLKQIVTKVPFKSLLPGRLGALRLPGLAPRAAGRTRVAKTPTRAPGLAFNTHFETFWAVVCSCVVVFVSRLRMLARVEERGVGAWVLVGGGRIPLTLRTSLRCAPALFYFCESRLVSFFGTYSGSGHFAE